MTFTTRKELSEAIICEYNRAVISADPEKQNKVHRL